MLYGVTRHLQSFYSGVLEQMSSSSFPLSLSHKLRKNISCLAKFNGILEKGSQVPNKLLEDIVLFLPKYAVVLLVEYLGEM